MTFALMASVVGNSNPSSGSTVGDTSTGSCTLIEAGDAGSDATVTDATGADGASSETVQEGDAIGPSDASAGDAGSDVTNGTDGGTGSDAAPAQDGAGAVDAAVADGDASSAPLNCAPPANDAACNSLPVFNMVMPSCSDAQAPAPQGGTIADGTYVLQAVTTYGAGMSCDVGPLLQETVAIGGGCEQATFVQTPSGPGSPNIMENVAITIDAGVLYGTVTCPPGMPSLLDAVPYTVGAGGQLTFFLPNTNGSCDGGRCPGTSVFVLQKQ
jgi:hypothetical protein